MLTSFGLQQCWQKMTPQLASRISRVLLLSMTSKMWGDRKRLTNLQQPRISPICISTSYKNYPNIAFMPYLSMNSRLFDLCRFVLYQASVWEMLGMCYVAKLMRQSRNMAARMRSGYLQQQISRLCRHDSTIWVSRQQLWGRSGSRNRHLLVYSVSGSLRYRQRSQCNVRRSSQQDRLFLWILKSYFIRISVWNSITSQLDGSVGNYSSSISCSFLRVLTIIAKFCSFLCFYAYFLLYRYMLISLSTSSTLTSFKLVAECLKMPRFIYSPMWRSQNLTQSSKLAIPNILNLFNIICSLQYRSISSTARKKISLLSLVYEQTLLRKWMQLERVYFAILFKQLRTRQWVSLFIMFFSICKSNCQVQNCENQQRWGVDGYVFGYL